MQKFYILMCLLCSFFVIATKLFDSFDEPKLLKRVKTVYGDTGFARTEKWLKLLESSKNDSQWNQLNKVNTFINNQVSYLNDLSLWGKKDYWASPVETLGRGKGDCEDFAIAKFFSLVALGVPENKLRLMYVRQLTVNEPHMVLIYFEAPGKIPLVLDNYDRKIQVASARRDLRPIYSFNGNGLWMAKAKGMGKKVKNSRGISAWTSLVQRIEEGELNNFHGLENKQDSYVRN
ncbi:transglutaminase-like cysteine peptidase [Pseudoalteromonas denitrificans]|uniref:transglutaminase-like cysteine peptidase n=1 Tax=Pseudoalteromonas denitrificans TaxID=43656 RepID=UPI001FEB1CCF|nr:transglutaminase-like cysteine peptidase [Pseudoalteromonas denitrificans]